MLDYKKELDVLQKEIDEKKVQRAKLEERLENLQKEKKQIKEDLKGINVTFNELEDVLTKLEVEIKEELEKCQKTLN